MVELIGRKKWAICLQHHSKQWMVIFSSKVGTVCGRKWPSALVWVLEIGKSLSHGWQVYYQYTQKHSVSVCSQCVHLSLLSSLALLPPPFLSLSLPLSIPFLSLSFPPLYYHNNYNVYLCSDISFSLSMAINIIGIDVLRSINLQVQIIIIHNRT